MEALEITGAREPRFLSALATGWDRILAQGGIAYDPVHALCFEEEGWRFHHVPGRSRRPVADGLTAEAYGVARAHTPCPFEGPELLKVREILRFQRQGRTYHLIANKFPVKRLHFLGVRSSAAPQDLLPQCLFGAQEIEDLLLLCRGLGPPLHFFFNSNSGSDGSCSGSTVNHWHVQIFPHQQGAMNLFFDELDRHPGRFPRKTQLFKGRMPGWEYPHRLYRSSRPELVAEPLWADARRAVSLDIAFNVEMAAEEGEAVTAAFFARAPVPPIRIEGAGELSNRFGGWELTGEVVVYDRPVYDWLAERPKEAVKIARERLRAGTRDIW